MITEIKINSEFCTEVFTKPCKLQQLNKHLNKRIPNVSLEKCRAKKDSSFILCKKQETKNFKIYRCLQKTLYYCQLQIQFANSKKTNESSGQNIKQQKSLKRKKLLASLVWPHHTTARDGKPNPGNLYFPQKNFFL